MTIELVFVILSVFVILIGIGSCIVSIWLMVRYIGFNRIQNSAGLTGQEVARKILDNNGLHHIGVKATGSMMFGNSYSHYFKKVRLRRMTRYQTSLTSLGIGAQKASLAILDKEGDPDMRRRIRLVPMITFGPLAFIPLILIGVLLDILIFHSSGVMALVLSGFAILFYFYSFILSLMTLKTEIKAQKRAYDILREEGIVTEGELADIKELFKLYNIQYVNDAILSFLELLYNILRIAMQIKNKSEISFTISSK